MMYNGSCLILIKRNPDYLYHFNSSIFVSCAVYSYRHETMRMLVELLVHVEHNVSPLFHKLIAMKSNIGRVRQGKARL